MVIILHILAVTPLTTRAQRAKTILPILEWFTTPELLLPVL